MSQNKKSKAEIAKELELHMLELHEQHEEYISRIENRIKSGEKLELKSFESWIRKANKTVDGQDIEILVSGDSGETRNERFLRLGKARMEKTLYQMDLLINLSSPQYEAKPEQIEKIINALRLKVTDIENSFKVQTKLDDEFEF